jgi:N-sulfoglucosamine sulfohydrolase
MSFARFLLLLAVTATALAAPARPHLVVLLSDDHGLLDTPVYGSREVRTPNLERLAAAGMTFDRAFVASPSCGPSRASLLTGLMPARHGAEANHHLPRAGIKKWPAYFRELGYEVVAFGKVGHYNQTREYGFDHAAHTGFHDAGAADGAIAWLRARQSDRPLCFIFGTNWPHTPWPADAGEYRGAEVRLPPPSIDTSLTRANRARYYHAIAKMDAEIGAVYAAARQVLGENTFFIHTSDHGAQWPFSKWSCYDAGIRTPLIAVWPGRIAAGQRTAAMVSWIDLLPTLLELAGSSSPADIDGRSFARVLQGQSPTHREMIFTTHTGDGDMNVYPIRSVRTSEWKYIRNLYPDLKYTTHIDLGKSADGGYFESWRERAKSDPAAAAVVQRYHVRPSEELYDLRADPHELDNLATHAEHRGTIERLRRQLDDWMRTQGDERKLIGKSRRND